MIKQFAIATAAAAMLAGPAVAEKPKGEQRLAEMLEGREAGEPQRCIRMRPSDSLTIIDNTAIVYKRGDTVWVNETQRPDDLDDNDVLVIRKFEASKLCRLDHITTTERYSGVYTGNIFLTDFVPYKRTAKPTES